MEKYNEATPQRPDGFRILNDAIVFADLQKFSAQIKSEESWHDSDRNSITIYKSSSSTIVLVALHEGAEMIENAVEGSLILHVLEGKVQFKSDDQNTELIAGQLLIINEDSVYSFTAGSDTMFLITLHTELRNNL